MSIPKPVDDSSLLSMVFFTFFSWHNFFLKVNICFTSAKKFTANYFHLSEYLFLFIEYSFLLVNILFHLSDYICSPST
jgi:hypothetical protein